MKLKDKISSFRLPHKRESAIKPKELAVITKKKALAQGSWDGSQFQIVISEKQLKLRRSRYAVSSADSLDYSQFANPLYSKHARFLRKVWEVRQKQVNAINRDQPKTREFCGERQLSHRL
jgi:hypothetical protein